MSGSRASALQRLDAMHRLGWRNVLAVLRHRASCKLGVYRRVATPGVSPRDPLLPPPDEWPAVPVDGQVERTSPNDEAARLLNGEFRFFGRHAQSLGDPPDWFLDPFTGERREDLRHWSILDDFEPGAGDIKCLWEASRFDWAPPLARAWRETGERRFLETLGAWVEDWTRRNPPFLGPQWKCGQETSIRLLNLLLALDVAGIPRGGPGLPSWVAMHCRRVRETLRYAVAQNNNHGISEAAALFVGGAWLARHPAATDGDTARAADGWLRVGRRHLEDRVAELIAPDGSFSQYSVNYHRLVLETLALAEWWRRGLDQPGFSRTFHTRARAAVEWLHHVVDPESGHAPNLGGNDGARPYRLSGADYRDLRPTLQLAAGLFLERRALPSGPWDEPLRWLRLDVTGAEVLPPRRTRRFPDGGFAVLAPAGTPTWGLVRFAAFRFRPAHADVLHLDIWAHGRNLLRDAGTYSYRGGSPWDEYFPGTRAHNTCEFDGRDQMPRLSRFLFGDWLQMDPWVPPVDDDDRHWRGRYTDRRGAIHERSVALEGACWTVSDRLRGYRQSATLRWRLAPGPWCLDGHRLVGDGVTLQIEVEGKLRRLELVEGWESRYYMERTPVPVLEVVVDPPAAHVETTLRIER